MTLERLLMEEGVLELLMIGGILLFVYLTRGKS